jgi:hypothetical protein
MSLVPESEYSAFLDLPHEAAIKIIEQKCSEVGNVKAVEIFRNSTTDAKPFALIAMDDAGHTKLLVQRFGGHHVGAWAMITLGRETLGEQN